MLANYNRRNIVTDVKAVPCKICDHNPTLILYGDMPPVYKCLNQRCGQPEIDAVTKWNETQDEAHN